MERFGNLNSVMETETISKNGASPKSLMSRGNLLRMFFIIAVSALLFSCFNDIVKEDNDNPPLTENETKFITEESGRIIDQYIENVSVNSGVLDLDVLSREIGLIKGVKSATPAESGEFIYIEQEDGFFTNAFVLRMDDERIIKEISNNAELETQSANRKNILKNSEGDDPSQTGKAIILDPFNFSVNEESGTLIGILEGMGYKVDYYPDDKADLSKFKGDNLRQYDVVYILTHGAKNVKGRFGDTFAGALSTGEEFNEKYYESLPDQEKRLLGSSEFTIKGVTKKYFSISDEWLQYTTNGSYSNSWVFLNVCHGFVFSDYFLRNGAGGVNGFNTSVHSRLGNLAVIEMARLLSQGIEFNIASAMIQQSITLDKFKWAFFTTLRLFGNNIEKAIAGIQYYSFLANDNKVFFLKDYSKGTEEVNSIIGEWSCITSGLMEDYNVSISLRENGIARFLIGTGTWNNNGNSVTIRFTAYDNISLTLNGTVNSNKTQITGTCVEVCAEYDEDGEFVRNVTFRGSFVMNKIQGKANVLEFKSLTNKISSNKNIKNIHNIFTGNKWEESNRRLGEIGGAEDKTARIER